MPGPVEEWYTVAINQLLVGYGIIEETQLKAMLKMVAKDHPGPNTSAVLQRPLNDVFSQLNSNLRDFGMEIKTAVIKKTNSGEAAGFTYFHGIVNTEDDQIAKEYGSRHSPPEVQIFDSLCDHFIEHRFISSHEVADRCKARNVDSSSLLHKLESEKWIVRNDMNYWELGPKSFLELSGMLHTMVAEAAANDTATQPNTRRLTAAELPQIIIY